MFNYFVAMCRRTAFSVVPFCQKTTFSNFGTAVSLEEVEKVIGAGGAG